MSIRNVTVDTNVDQIVEWSRAGDKLIFNPKSLPQLKDRELKAMSPQARAAYQRALFVKSNPRLDVLGGSASGRTRVLGGDPDQHYVLKRMDEYEESMDLGYQPVTEEDPVITPGMVITEDGSRRIRRQGRDEMVLLKVDKDRYKEHLKSVSDQSRQVADKARDAAVKAGRDHGIDVVDKTRRAREE